MSIQVQTYLVTTGLRHVYYRPATETDPAHVRISFAGYVTTLDVDIDDARKLFYDLGVALVDHAVAQGDPRGAWAVA